MPVNSGYIGGGLWNPVDNAHVEWRCYYNAAATPVGPTQPIVNGPNGFAFESPDPGPRFTVRVWMPTSQTWQEFRTQANHKANQFTAAQLAGFGIVTRGDVRIEGPVLD